MPADIEEVRVCPDCDEPLEDDNTEPRYVCNQCGEEFGKSNSADSESSRCPSCNKFSSRDGEVHEGCSTDISDAETKYRCGACSEVYDEQAEAEACDCEDAVEDDGETLEAPGGDSAPSVKFPCPRCDRLYNGERMRDTCPCGPAKEAT